MSDQEVVINIDDTDEIHTSGEPNDAVQDLKSQFSSLQKQLEQERARAAQAEQRVATIAAQRDVSAIDNGISRAQAEANAAQTELVRAAEEGAFERQAEAQRRIARAEAELVELEGAKANLGQRQRQAPPGDPVEAFIASRDPATAKWLRDHPDDTKALVLDPNSRQARKLMAAHADALAEGHAEGSSNYFTYIERFAGMTGDGSARPRRSSPPAAPVSGAGGAGGSRSSGGTQVTLTAGEASAATDGTHTWNPGNIHPQTGKPIRSGDPIIGTAIGTREFARRKLAMQRQGLYGGGND